MIPDKLPKLPKKLFKDDWTIIGEKDDLDDDGNTISLAEINCKAYFSGKPTHVLDKNKHLIRIQGVLIVLGDIYPEEAVTQGSATFKGLAYRIHSISRPKNPDCSVYATVMELI